MQKVSKAAHSQILPTINYSKTVTLIVILYIRMKSKETGRTPHLVKQMYSIFNKKNVNKMLRPVYMMQLAVTISSIQLISYRVNTSCINLS